MHLSKAKLLPVEDNDVKVKSKVAAPEKFDYEVTVATDGVDAMMKAIALLPDLILLDTIIPKMDGFEVCRCHYPGRNSI
jgi:CheY-like chemotaxis protein